MLPKPCLIIVNGPPASGKTTLARQLGRDLQFPVFHRDELKENLFDNFGWGTPEIEQKMKIASYKLLYQIFRQFLSSNQSLIIESNFNQQFDSPQFQKLLKNSTFRVIQIHCTAKPKILFARFKKRAQTDRHPGHQDLNILDDWQKKSKIPHQPLLINNSISLQIDTSTPTKLNYKKLLNDLKFETYYAYVERAFYAAGAFAIILNKKGEVLLCHREDRDLWSMPGGIIDNNENPWQAVIREVKEETGLIVKIDRLTGMYFKAATTKEKNENLLFSFLCQVKSGRLTTSRETSKFKYFPTHKLPANLSPNQKERIADYLKSPNKPVFKTQKFIG